VSSYPFDVLGAQAEGMIGYLIEQELGNLLPFDKPLATILTMTEVDPTDPTFDNPTKFVGPIYSEGEAHRLAAERGWAVKRDGGLPATGRPIAGASAHLRAAAGGMAPRAQLRRRLRRRWRHPHDVPSRDPDTRRRGGGH
jgi:hypothetical protein